MQYDRRMLKNLVTLIALCSGLPATAQTIAAPASGEILAGWREAGGTHYAGLAIDLAPGWKTYWRTPGDGGIPPQFNWSGSENLGAVSVTYPMPKVIDQLGMLTVGYDSDVVFPLTISAQDQTSPITLRGEVEIGVCEEVCIPMMLRVSGTLPANGAPDPRIMNVLKNQPRQAGRLGCEIVPIADGLRLTARLPAPSMRIDMVVIEPGERGVWTSQPQLTKAGGVLIAEVEMVPPNAQPFALARNDLRLTLIGNGQAIERKGCR